MLDCVVIGGGPAGLAAALYLSRFRRSVSVLDGGQSRARLIPCTNNVPGFPEGIAGQELLSRLRSHAARFAVPIERLTVSAMRRLGEGFAIEAGARVIHARTVVLATGVLDRRPRFDDLDPLIRRGLVRLCPVCDAHEAIGCRIGVLGPADRSIPEARFLRTFTERITAIVTDRPKRAGSGLDEHDRDSGIVVIDADIQALDAAGPDLLARLSDGGEHRFDALYVALGADPGSVLGMQLGAKVTSSGCILVDRHQRTSVPGLYAAGDVVEQLNQISVAFGHAAIAATAIHNDLRNGRADAPAETRSSDRPPGIDR